VPSLTIASALLARHSLVQEIAWNLGGTVAKCSHREYGFARVQVNKFGSDRSSVDALFEGLGDEMEVRHELFFLYFANAARPVVLPLISGLDPEGMDVSWRPDLCAPSRFPYHWPYDIRALCGHCP
jgi:hypothetical protein